MGRQARTDDRALRARRKPGPELRPQGSFESPSGTAGRAGTPERPFSVSEEPPRRREIPRSAPDCRAARTGGEFSAAWPYLGSTPDGEFADGMGRHPSVAPAVCVHHRVSHHLPELHDRACGLHRDAAGHVGAHRRRPLSVSGAGLPSPKLWRGAPSNWNCQPSR